MYMDSYQLVELAAEACDNKKATDIKFIQVDKVSSLADWMLIAGGFTSVQVQAIARSVQDHLQQKANRLPLRSEGINEGKWALLDYGELIVHILQPSERSYYDLEAFWSSGECQDYKNSLESKKD